MNALAAAVHPYKQLLFRILSIFILSYSLFLLVFFITKFEQFQMELDERFATEQVRIELAEHIVSRNLSDAITDIRWLAKTNAFTDYVNDNNVRNQRRLVEELVNLELESKLYDQIRIIGVNGREEIRVNYNHGAPAVVDREYLQDKSNRYYFSQAIKLPPHQIYVSSLDLNVENGKVEIPFKPMIRIAMPLYSQREELRGILVLNYLAQRILGQFEDAMRASTGLAMMLNSEGYWLYNSDHENEWGFMWNKKPEFVTRFPITWRSILKTTGSIRNTEGFFSIAKLNPIELYEHSGQIKLDSNQWILAIWLPPELIHMTVIDVLLDNQVVLTLLFLLILLLSTVIAYLRTNNLSKRQAIALSQSRFRNLVDNMVEAYALLELIEENELNFRYLEINPAYENIVGKSRVNVIGKTTRELFPQLEQHWLELLFSAAINQNAGRLEEYSADLGRYFEVSASSPGSGLVAIIFDDVTERKHTEARLRQGATVFDNTMEAILIANAAGYIESVNNAFVRLTGYSLDDVRDNELYFQQRDFQAEPFYAERQKSLTTYGQWQGETRNRRKNGEVYPAWENITVTRSEDGKITNYISVFSDISVIKQNEQELTHLAHHDVLTGLNNRLSFSANLEQAIQRAQRHRTKLALLFLDLDRFKLINDTLGHAVGDEVLRIVAVRLKNNVRAQDIVSRLGGDEFTIILEDIASRTVAANFAQKIIESISKKMQVDDHELAVSTSVGICLFPQDASNAQDLAKSADSAMYQAKKSGRQTYEFYSTELTEISARRLTTESNLRQALLKDELQVYYQPQIDVQSRKIIGVEALLRWIHPDRGVLLPDEFIQVVEETRLIVQLGDWVFDQIYNQAKLWRKFSMQAPIRIAINLSLRQLIHSHAETSTVRQLKKIALLSKEMDLQIEITESVLRSGEIINVTLQDLRKLGVTVAIDGFGMGYSCLRQLNQLPVDTLKIDKSFLHGIPNDANNAALTKSIILLGHNLGLSVAAEGVETLAQLEFLREQECDEAQGYLMGKPVTAAEMEKILSGRRLPKHEPLIAE